MLTAMRWDHNDAITHDLCMCGHVIKFLTVTLDPIVAFGIPLVAVMISLMAI